jgi:hypothetical protein
VANVRTLSQQDRFKIAYRDDFTCKFCGARPGNDKIEIEHLIPVSLCGSDNEENLVAACKKCNRGKSTLVAFPKSMCEGVDRINSAWIVHKSFGEWQVKFHPEDGVVLEYTPFEYWISADRAHEMDWEAHIRGKQWGAPHKFSDFIEALTYFRRMTKAN